MLCADSLHSSAPGGEEKFFGCTYAFAGLSCTELILNRVGSKAGTAGVHTLVVGWAEPVCRLIGGATRLAGRVDVTIRGGCGCTVLVMVLGKCISFRHVRLLYC